MALTPVYRAAGQTVGLSVAASSHAAVQITATDQSQFAYALFVNTGATGATPLIIYVTTAATQGQSQAAVVPTDGVGVLAFPIVAGLPIVIAVPGQYGSIWVQAIASSAGPTLLTVTPVVPM